MAITVLIADDEERSREQLERDVCRNDQFEVIGKASNGKEAIEMILAMQPHVAFLDIHMPLSSGIEVARAVVHMDQPPLIIFITAFDKHAVEAFELNAIDYILKPYDSKRLDKTIKKIEDTCAHKNKVEEKIHTLLQFLERKHIAKISCYERGMKDRIFINTSAIFYVHVKNTETIVVTQDGEFLSSSNLKELMSELDPHQFFQPHRSYLVNLDKIKKVSPLFVGNYVIILDDGKKTEIPLSRSHAKKLRNIIKF